MSPDPRMFLDDQGSIQRYRRAHMKSYSLGDRHRSKYIIAFAGMAVLIANAFWEYFPKLTGLELPNVALGWGAFMGSIFAVLYYSFTSFAWKVPLVQKWTNVPNLNGIWIGELARQSFLDEEDERGVPVVMRIEQSFTHMAIELQNNLSPTSPQRSVSGTTSIDLSGNFTNGFTLTQGFEGRNEDGGTFFGIFEMGLNRTGSDWLIDGDYISSAPRRGQILLKRTTSAKNLILGEVRKMTSSSGSNYLGVTIQKKHTIEKGRVLRKTVGREVFSTLLNNRLIRDGSNFHITLVDPLEYSELSEKQLEMLEGKKGHFILGGLGRVEMDGAQSFYILVASPFGDYLRSIVKLPRKDFHVTLGFDPHDIHVLPKDASTVLE